MSGRYSARQARISAGPALDPNPWTSPVTRAAILLVTVFSNGNFNDAIIPGSETSNLQQYVVIVLWITVATVSYFRRAVVRIDPAAGFFMGLAPYAIAIVSVLWSDVPAASLPKAIAMGLVIFAAFRLVRTMALDEIVESVIHGLFLLNLVSIFLALFVPGIDRKSVV